MCNGSTPDSDSVCGGSNPSSSANNSRYPKRISGIIIFLYRFSVKYGLHLQKIGLFALYFLTALKKAGVICTYGKHPFCTECWYFLYAQCRMAICDLVCLRFKNSFLLYRRILGRTIPDRPNTHKMRDYHKWGGERWHFADFCQIMRKNFRNHA